MTRTENTGIAESGPADSPPCRTISSIALAVCQVSAVFLILVAARWQIIDSPPYWDASISIWVEATALVQEGLDVRRHWFELPSWGSDGPVIYRFSLLPVLIAALMTYLPTPKSTFLAYHLFTFACAAAVAVLVYHMLARRNGLLPAVLAASACLTTPLFCTQIDMLAMEIPLALATIVCASLITSHRFLSAAMVAVTGFFLKATMVVVLAAVLILVIGVAILAPARAQISRWSVWGAILISALGLAAACNVVFGEPEHNIVRFAYFGPVMWLLPAVWSPDLALLGLVTLAIYVPWLLFHRADGLDPQSWLERLQTRLFDTLAVSFALLVAGGVIASLAFVSGIPRYMVVFIPVLMCAFTETLRLAGMSARARVVLLSSVVVLNLVNWNGLLLPGNQTLDYLVNQRRTFLPDCDGSLLERSHAYLDDHRANIAAMKALSDAWDGSPVFAGLPFVNFLAMPALGYVDRPLAGYVTNGWYHDIGGFRDAAHAVVDRPLRSWFVFSRNPCYQKMAWFVVPEPDPDRDRVVFANGNPVRLAVFQRPFDETLLRPFTGNWFLGQLRPHPDWNEATYLPNHRSTTEASLRRIGRDDIWQRYQRELLR